MPRASAAATASTLRLAEVSPSCPLIAFNSCMVLGPTTSPPEHPTPPGPLCALLSLYRSGAGPWHLLLSRPRLTKQLDPSLRDLVRLGTSRTAGHLVARLVVVYQRPFAYQFPKGRRQDLALAVVAVSRDTGCCNYCRCDPRRSADHVLRSFCLLLGHRLVNQRPQQPSSNLAHPCILSGW